LSVLGQADDERVELVAEVLRHEVGFLPFLQFALDPCAHRECFEAMTNKREKAREQWEQEVRARHQNITSADHPEGLHYVRGDHLPTIVSQGRFWFGIVLTTVSVSVFRFTPPAGVVAVAGIAAGLCLIITAMRLNDKR
jgi:hypothetical protein